jgi:ATP-binding cassette subfamily C protein/ATP-binding cassette subfamily C protein EexD
MSGKPDQVLKATMAGCRRSFVHVALFSMFINILILTVPLYMLQIFDRVLASESLETLLYLSLIALGAIVTLGLLELVRSRILVRLSSWIEQHLAPEAFERSVAATLRGKPYRTEALRDLGQLRSLFAGPAILALFDAPWVPIFLVAVFLLHPVIGTIAAAGALLLFVFAVLNELAIRTPWRAANQAAIRSMQRAEATTRNAEAIDAMGMMPAVVARWLSTNREVLRHQATASDRAGSFVALSKFWRLAVQIAVLGAGAFLAVERELTAGGMIAGSILTSRALAPVDHSIGTWRQVVAARAAYLRLWSMFRSITPRVSSMPLPPPQGHLAVERLAFAYPGSGASALRGITLEILPGQALAVVGPSAAGKSTLARLLVGVWPPSSGVVRLDGADVSLWDRADFGRYVGYLPQDVELFAGTVRDNIARMGDPPPGAVVHAAKMARVHDMILRLPLGYETEIGEGGTVLSGGQRQRIALARALLGRPRLLVLDEPNSNLDSEGEQALSDAIQAVKDDRGAVVIIAHRPSLLEHVDKILVLRDGQIHAYGASDEIMKLITRPRAVARPDQVLAVSEPPEARAGP